MIDLHHAGEHQTVKMRAQATDVSRELEGQHGDGTVRKVHAGPTQAGFLIEPGIGRHIMGHIGDVHLQFEVAVFEMADGDRIIEIARRFAVDGDNR